MNAETVDLNSMTVSHWSAARLYCAACEKNDHFISEESGDRWEGKVNTSILVVPNFASECGK
jgi:hypothetical protein